MAVILTSLPAEITNNIWGQYQLREDLEKLAAQQGRRIAVIKNKGDKADCL